MFRLGDIIESPYCIGSLELIVEKYYVDSYYDRCVHYKTLYISGPADGTYCEMSIHYVLVSDYVKVGNIFDKENDDGD